MDRDYCFENVLTSRLICTETKLQISKSLIIDWPKNYGRLSQWCCTPRQPWNHYHLAVYDVKQLKTGDKIMLRRKNGLYKESEIEKLEFETEEKNTIKSLKLKGIEQKWFEGVSMDVSTFCDGYVMSMMSWECNYKKYNSIYKSQVPLLILKKIV